MKVVKVYGALRKRLGQCRFEFDVTTPAQAIKALCVNFPGLEKWLIDSEKDGVGYRVAISKEKVTEENVDPLLLPFSEKRFLASHLLLLVRDEALGRFWVGIGFIALALLRLWRLSVGIGGSCGKSRFTGFAAVGTGCGFGSKCLGIGFDRNCSGNFTAT